MIIDVEKLKNRGLFRLRSAPAAEAKTVIVLSAPRACSSLVAGALYHLGVFMGDSTDDIVFEDNKLAGCFERGDHAAAEEVIRVYNNRHAVWGFKRPAALGYAEQLLPRVRNPHLIVVFRDALATALRDRIAANVDVLRRMEQVVMLHAQMLKMLQTTTYPTLLVSAEKIRAYPMDLVAELCSFLDLKCTEEQSKAAASFIEPTPLRYITEARANRARGHLEALEPRRISGWVRLIGKETPCHVVVKVNGTVRATACADLYRADLFAHGVHSTGKCGFQISLDENQAIDPQDDVQVVTEEDPVSFLFAAKPAERGKSPGGKNG